MKAAGGRISKKILNKKQKHVTVYFGGRERALDPGTLELSLLLRGQLVREAKDPA